MDLKTASPKRQTHNLFHHTCQKVELAYVLCNVPLAYILCLDHSFCVNKGPFLQVA